MTANMTMNIPLSISVVRHCEQLDGISESKKVLTWNAQDILIGWFQMGSIQLSILLLPVVVQVVHPPAGGGGAGGFSTHQNLEVVPGQPYVITVGSGGAARTSAVPYYGNDGTNSSLANTTSSIVAIEGGGGGAAGTW